jgi:hypothetical protein
MDIMMQLVSFTKYRIIFLGLAIWLGVAISGCASLPEVFQNPRYTYENGALLVGGDGEPILLTNNTAAVNPSFQQVLDFIRADLTDQLVYIERDSNSGATPFVCSDFAEIVHNNAEEAGIRAAYLSVDFEDGGVGHAINAFDALDQGMVYIDCTGQSFYSELEEGDGSIESWDKVAYIEIGHKYGVISLTIATSAAYDFYVQFEKKWQDFKEQLAAYNAEVKRYNQEITGKIYRKGSVELAGIRVWEEQLQQKEAALDVLKQEIGSNRFKPLGVVKSTWVHW